MDTKSFGRPTWVEIDLDAVSNNVNELKKILGDKVTIIGALKATGYGHGLVPMAKHLVKLGICILSVGNIHEGIRLRKAGITVPILIFGGSLPEAGPLYVENDLMPSFINSTDPEEYVKILGPKVPLKVWIKVETGLGRCGVFPDEVVDMIRRVRDNTPYQIEGVYSHIGTRAALAEPRDINYCEGQWGRFKKIVDELERLDIKIPYLQIASSHASLAMPYTWLNCVTPGLSLYTNPETVTSKYKLNFLESYKAIRSKLISVKKFKAGNQIGGTELERDSLIGVAPIGIGDGLSAKNKGHSVLVRGRRARIIGSVNLEHIRIDVTNVPGVSVADEVTILGEQGNDAITIKEMCDRIGMSTLEFYTSIHHSLVPYVFLKHGVVSDVEIVGETP